MTPPPAKCEVCGVVASVYLNNRPLCGEHAWEETKKVKK